MKSQQLQTKSQFELATLLRDCERNTAQWRRIKAECEKRYQRWSQVSYIAWIGLLVCMFILAIATLR